jgi:hypothetical protein
MVADNLPLVLRLAEALNNSNLIPNIGLKGDQGNTGKQGKQGEQGERGDAGENGTNGKNGTNGRNGIDGVDGNPGKDAPHIYLAAVNTIGHLILVLSDKTVIDAGQVSTGSTVRPIRFDSIYASTTNINASYDHHDTSLLTVQQNNALIGG